MIKRELFQDENGKQASGSQNSERKWGREKESFISKGIKGGLVVNDASNFIPFLKRRESDNPVNDSNILTAILFSEEVR